MLWLWKHLQRGSKLDKDLQVSKITLHGKYLEDWQPAQTLVQVDTAVQLSHVNAGKEVLVGVHRPFFHESSRRRLLCGTQLGCTCMMHDLHIQADRLTSSWPQKVYASPFGSMVPSEGKSVLSASNALRLRGMSRIHLFLLSGQFSDM